MSKSILEYEPGKDIITTSRILKRYIDSRVSCEEVSGVQGRILGMIVYKAQQGDELYQRDVEAEFHIRGATVTNILQLMEKKGLIVRCRSGRDSRLKRILPTEEGNRVHGQICSSITKAEEDLLTLFTEEELIMYRSMLERLREFAAEHKGGRNSC